MDHRRPATGHTPRHQRIHLTPDHPAGVLTPGKEHPMDMRHMVETHWTEQRSEDQIDYLDA